ncbi:MAG: hypothetical protein Q7J03_00660, partial [Methanoregula sp.]|nr:hypothetical protein [Methanoregula sp.]
MDEIISRDDEKGRELAQEKGRKQGQQEERARKAQKGGRGTGVTIILSLVVLAIIVAAIGFLTLSVSVMTASPGNALPFTTNYAVTFPEG